MNKEKGGFVPAEDSVQAGIDLNRAIHRMLILGLVVSTAAMLAGLALSAMNHSPLPTRIIPFAQIFSGLKTGAPASFLSLGMLLLIATPVLRVIGSIAEFIIQRDWRYACVTLMVLLILIISVVVGRG